MDKDIFYMAPMLGITDASFRTAFTKHLGGFDLAVGPFVRTLQGQRYKASAVEDLRPKYNKNIKVQPQVMTNNAEDFIHLANELFDLGYHHINLNMGCPMPTSSGRSKGAGLLKEKDRVDMLLNDVLPKIPNRLSIKTRIGFDSEVDLLDMSEMLNQYPIEEIMIHPRTAKQKYSGSVNHDRFQEACANLSQKIVFSGDINTVEDFRRFKETHPHIRRWMIGRGILKDPFLMLKIRGTEVENKGNIFNLYKSLFDLYISRGMSEHVVLKRLKILSTYLTIGQSSDKSTVKSIRKAKNTEYFMDQIRNISNNYKM